MPPVPADLEGGKIQSLTSALAAVTMRGFDLDNRANRAGKNLPEKKLHTLDEAKDELREVFGRPKGRPKKKRAST